ncbi:MAG: FtsX-like permease family protein [Proteobacteria bacterium]|nr:FtsX-like permease family protein [Pseudomonadota bacterium]
MNHQLRPLKKTLKSFKRQPLLHLASIATISVSCLIMGSFFLGYRNFESIAEKTNPHMTGTVYLKEGLNDNQIALLKENILSQENVLKAAFKSKRKVADELQVFLGTTGSEILPGSELFPDLIELELNPETTSQEIAALKSILGKDLQIAEVDFSEDWLTQYKKVRSILTTIGWVLISALVIGCGFIIANFMGMRHQSRKEEMEIVQLIGAETSFVLAPFLWEGIIEGVLGAGFSMTLLLLAKWLLGDVLASNWGSVLGVSSWMFLSVAQCLLLLFVGITMALVGSIAVFLRTSEHV